MLTFRNPFLYLWAAGCVRINPCASNPCQHGGVCSASGSTFTCDCSGTTDFTGDRCETRINVREG